MGTRVGQKTVRFDKMPIILSTAAVAGNAEKTGPYGSTFDIVFDDDLWGEKTYELAERKMLIKAIETAMAKAGLKPDDISYLLGGDLLNQIISAGFAARQLGIPFFGLYGACSTMAESLMLGAMIVDGGFAKYAACATSSHFATAERQFRNPLELGTPKTPTSQNTVTASGAAILSSTGDSTYPAVTYATTGRVIDMGINDVNNMGAAMAPAAAETIISHLEETGRKAGFYDHIVTGDLGTFGSELMLRIASDAGYDMTANHLDCGVLIYQGNELMHCGGSGCGCSASMLCGHFINSMNQGTIKRILFVATGVLHSPTSALQGESIPAIAHAVSLEMGCGS
ncbi:MAG: stage V sporulation protein AD [Eubacteriales bacterium]|nr:stage V sporulation protein AD [Eubacteriales bacterium]